MAETIEYEKGLTFEKVWAALMEDREQMRLSYEKAEQQREADRKEADRQREEDRKEAERRHKEAEAAAERRREEADRRMKELDEGFKRSERLLDRVTANMGGLNNSMGELVENLIAARLWEKFDAYPYKLRQAQQRVRVYEEHTSRVLTDIDILLANGEYAMAVEVKTHLNRKDDVDYHLKRMELIRKNPPAQCVGRKLLGAMVGGSVDPDVRDYAHRTGFFVLELTGENVTLAECPPGFKPGEW